jgi:hypothetical protein
MSIHDDSRSVPGLNKISEGRKFNRKLRSIDDFGALSKMPSPANARQAPICI